jgi:hypothetical protein
MILSHEEEMRRRRNLSKPRARPVTPSHRMSQSDSAVRRHARERAVQLALEAATCCTVTRRETRAIIKALKDKSV